MSIVNGIPTTIKRGDAATRINPTTLVQSTGAISDTDILKRPAVGLILHSAGAISFVTIEGDTVTFASGELAVGTPLPFEIKQVRSTGTALTGAQFSLLFSRR